MILRIDEFAENLKKLSRLTRDTMPKIILDNNEICLNFRYDLSSLTDENAKYLNGITDKWQLEVYHSKLKVYFPLGE